ncbi:hypothetical protein, partial [Vibrio harveyi]|uniref:hypothetical protein n=1 Tax=Vibrio harveyi TaxID=669 RepID=UPI0005F04559
GTFIKQAEYHLSMWFMIALITTISIYFNSRFGVQHLSTAIGLIVKTIISIFSSSLYTHEIN